MTPPAAVIDDETFHSPTLRYVNEILLSGNNMQKPAMVLFTYHANGNSLRSRCTTRTSRGRMICR
jgi:hypothetical protein